MAWSWSHTQDAYESVHEQLLQKADKAQEGDRDSQEWLMVVWAEWKAEDEYSPGQFNMERYERALRKAYRRGVSQHTGWHQLAEDIWENAERLATCTNGGWEAYVCPSGCGCHLIPFTPEVNADA